MRRETIAVNLLAGILLLVLAACASNLAHPNPNPALDTGPAEMIRNPDGSWDLASVLAGLRQTTGYPSELKPALRSLLDRMHSGPVISFAWTELTCEQRRAHAYMAIAQQQRLIQHTLQLVTPMPLADEQVILQAVDPSLHGARISSDFQLGGATNYVLLWDSDVSRRSMALTADQLLVALPDQITAIWPSFELPGDPDPR